jgi:hypothetical protein
MTIADLIQRGNPDQGDDDWAVDDAPYDNSTEEIPGGTQGEMPSSQPHAGSHLRTAHGSAPEKLSKNVVIIAILLLSATASFGLGYLAGKQGSQANGLITGSIPNNSGSSTLDTASLPAGVTSMGTSTFGAGSSAVQK